MANTEGGRTAVGEAQRAPRRAELPMRGTGTDLAARVEVLEALLEELRASRAELGARVEVLEALVGGRNRSAPTKRNMTNADALRVMTGDLRELGHKEAASVAGLTYAQVYSCRCEFTFKHVHKDLSREGYKNPWAKP